MLIVKKDKCVSCGCQILLSDYELRGNYCVRCTSKAERNKFGENYKKTVKVMTYIAKAKI